MEVEMLAKALVELHKCGLVKDLLKSSMVLENLFGFKSRELDNKIDNVLMEGVSNQ